MDKNNNCFFSVIVPIYKVEKYLAQCVDSVLQQTFWQFELILIDDGSPDKCGTICDEYAKNDSRIITIHKKNSGLSSARNAGLEIASGEYIIFLDSDDFWDNKNALNNIHCHLIESVADVLIFPAKRYYENNMSSTDILKISVDRNRVRDSYLADSIAYMLQFNIYRAAAWNKVVNRTLISEHHMRFKEGYLSEDMDWCGDLLLYAHKFDFYDLPFYAYRQQRVGSITKVKSEKLVSDKLHMCEKGLKQAEECNNKEIGRLLASYYAYEYAVAIGVSSGVRNRDIIDRMKELNRIMLYDECKKVKKVKMLSKVFGFRLSRRLLCLFVKVKC